MLLLILINWCYKDLNITVSKQFEDSAHHFHMSGICISKIICHEVDREQELSENSRRVDVSHCEKTR